MQGKPEPWDRAPDSVRRSRAFHPSELPEHLKEALETARMDPRHEHLNALMDAGIEPTAAGLGPNRL